MSSNGLSETPTMLQKVHKAAINRWKLETLTGLIGIRSLQNHQRETERNIAAEGAAVRKQLWGSDETASADDDMGNTILGDVQYPTPIVVSGNQSGPGLLTGLAIAALGAAVPGAGLLGYVVSQVLKPTPVVEQVPPNDDVPDFSVGLGKIEDYLQVNP